MQPYLAQEHSGSLSYLPHAISASTGVSVIDSLFGGGIPTTSLNCIMRHQMQWPYHACPRCCLPRCPTGIHTPVDDGYRRLMGLCLFQWDENY